MVGYITTAHDIAQRLSEKWRHFVVHCLYSLFCTSPRCVGVLLSLTRTWGLERVLGSAPEKKSRPPCCVCHPTRNQTRATRVRVRCKRF